LTFDIPCLVADLGTVVTPTPAFTRPKAVGIVFATRTMGGRYLMMLRLEPAPLLLGLVLGAQMEENLHRALLLSRGDILVFVERPLNAAFHAIAALLPALTAFRGAAVCRTWSASTRPLRSSEGTHWITLHCLTKSSRPLCRAGCVVRHGGLRGCRLGA